MTRREEIMQQAEITVFPWDDVREQVKFEDRVDCFFRDDKIDDFIEKCALRIK